MVLLWGEGGVNEAVMMSVVVVGERVEGVVERCMVVVVRAVLQSHRGVHAGHGGYPGRDGGRRDIPRG